MSAMNYSDTSKNRSGSTDRTILELTAVEFTYKQFVHSLSLVFINRGWRVSCAFTPESASDSSKAAEAYLPAKYLNADFHRSLKLGLLLKTLRSLKRILQEDSSNVVHVHTPMLSYLTRLLALFWNRNKTRHLVYTVHGFYFNYPLASVSDFLHLCIELVLLPACDLVLFVSRSDFEFASRYLSYLRIPHKYIGNGVDMQLFSPIQSSERAPIHAMQEVKSQIRRSFVVGFVGRLVSEKGVGELLTAFEHFVHLYPGSKLLIIGSRLASDYDQSSELDDRLDKLSEQLPNSIIRTGMIRDKIKLISEYRRMDMFCLPSYREGLPTSLIEAMACGVAPIASRVRGCTQLISQRVNGLLVEAGNDRELLSAMCELAFSDDFRKEIASQARESVITDYSLSNILESSYNAISSNCLGAGTLK